MAQYFQELFQVPAPSMPVPRFPAPGLPVRFLAKTMGDGSKAIPAFMAQPYVALVSSFYGDLSPVTLKGTKSGGLKLQPAAAVSWQHRAIYEPFSECSHIMGSL